MTRPEPPSANGCPDPASSRRVLFLNHTAAVSGAEISLFHLVQGLRSRKAWQPMVAAPDTGRLTRLFRDAGSPVELIPLHPPSRHPFRNLSNARLLSEFVSRHDIDLVHANSFHAAKAIVLFTLASRVPTVASVRSIEPFPRPTSLALAACAATVCVSNATAENLLHRFPRQRRSRIHVIYNGIDPSLYRRPSVPGTPLAGLDLARVEKPVVTLLAPVVRWKGQHVFLEAAREFVRSHGSGTFLLVGHEDFADTAFLAEVRERARTPELVGRVSVTGFRDDVPDILADTDVVVCPSIGPDPFPRAVIEAMAAGCPVIGSRIGGIPEAIDEATGILVPPGDAQSITEALLTLVRNPEGAQAMGRRAAAEACSRFSVDAHVRRMTALYETILTGSGSPPAASRSALP